jgi:hypothetical protein
VPSKGEQPQTKRSHQQQVSQQASDRVDPSLTALKEVKVSESESKKPLKNSNTLNTKAHQEPD